MTTLQISDGALKEVLSESILKMLGEDGQKEIIKKAIVDLCAKRKSTSPYESRERPSIVEEEFGEAVARLARTVIHELVNDDPEIRANVEGIVRDAFAVFTVRDGQPRRVLVDALADGLARVWSGDSRR